MTIKAIQNINNHFIANDNYGHITAVSGCERHGRKWEQQVRSTHHTDTQTVGREPHQRTSSQTHLSTFIQVYVLLDNSTKFPIRLSHISHFLITEWTNKKLVKINFFHVNDSDSYEKLDVKKLRSTEGGILWEVSFETLLGNVEICCLRALNANFSFKRYANGRYVPS